MNKYTQFIQQANYLLFMVLVASLPFQRSIMQWCWILWVISWLLELRFLNTKNLQWGKQMVPSLFLLGWVIWECISLFWGQDVDAPTRFPSTHISLFILPFIMLYGVNKLYDWKKIAKVFIISCVCSFFLYTWLLYWVSNYDYVINCHGFGSKISFDFSYFDTMLSTIKKRMEYCSALGVALILLFMLRKDLIASWGAWKAYTFFFGSILVMSTAIIVTGSRANLLTLIILLAISMIMKAKRFRLLIAAGVAIACLSCFIAIWKYHPRMKDLTIEQMIDVENHYKDPMVQPRIVIWHLAVENPEDYLGTGLGAGNAKNYLADKFLSHRLYGYINHQLGAHNQYLSICMELGLVAMILFILFWYAIPFCYPKSSQSRQFALYFVLFYGINMLTDDNLSRTEGIIYTCCFLLMANLMSRQATDIPQLDS